jgi:t-SNARE complex subunit (syntaxin)
MDKLDDLFAEKGSGGTQDGGSAERALYDEEGNKIEVWKNEITDQDIILGRVANNVKILKGEARKINDKQDDVSKKVNEVSTAANKTEKKLDSTNKKIKDLLEKLGHDKICIDIILVCICLGLIAVLYNVIKSKISNPANSTAKNSTATTKLFY